MPENLAKYSVDINFKFMNEKKFDTFLKNVDLLGKSLNATLADEKKSPLGKAIKNLEKLGSVLSTGVLGRLMRGGAVASGLSILGARIRGIQEDMSGLSRYRLLTGESTQGLQQLQAAGMSAATPITKNEMQEMLQRLKMQSTSPLFGGGLPSREAQMLGFRIGATGEQNLLTMLENARRMPSGHAGYMLSQAGLDPRLLQLSADKINGFLSTYSEGQISANESSREYRNERITQLLQSINRHVEPLGRLLNYITGGGAGIINWGLQHNPLNPQNLLQAPKGIQNIFHNIFHIQSTDPQAAADETTQLLNNQSNLQAISPNP